MCETERKTEIEIHGYRQERYQEEWTDGRQHSRPQGLDIGSFQGDPLTRKSLQDEKVRSQAKHQLAVSVSTCIAVFLAKNRLSNYWLASI